MTLVSIVSYADRNVLALLAPTILRDTGLSATDYGWTISAFSIAYLVGNPFWGMALDRFGLRAGLAVAVALWTLASVSHAAVATAVGFASARALLGFGEGATFPGGLRTALQTLRPRERARGIAVAYGGGSIGAVVTPILITPVAAAWGWRGAFFFTGLLGATWLALWAVVAGDARLRRIARRERRPTRRPALRDFDVLAFMATYAFGGLPLGFVLYGTPIHLARALGYDQVHLGHVLWVPPLGWEIGYLFWGTCVDRASPGERASGHPVLFRAVALLSLPLAFAGLVPSGAAVLALAFVAMFASAGFVIVSLAEVTRGRTNHAAYLGGLGAGSWSALMAVVMPGFGHLLDARRFALAYAVAAIAPSVGFVLRAALRHRNARRPGGSLAT